MRANASANGVRLDFTDSNLLDGEPPAVDVICAGDIFYERPMTEAVLAWLERARARGTQVLIGDPGRSYLPKDKLTQLATYSVPVTRELEDAEIKQTGVWTLK